MPVRIFERSEMVVVIDVIPFVDPRDRANRPEDHDIVE
jgi:hypothetical protein